MEDLLSTLNPAQRNAVTTLSGPLLILAGAGTGKTKVLTHRISYLIQTEQFKVEDILALTFTEKAANEMQERLDVLLPYGYGELWVKTFHGFCEAILRERGLEIGLDTHYQLLPQTELWMFLREKLFTFDLEYYRPLGNPTRFVVALAQHFSLLRDELITPRAYLTYAEETVVKAQDEADREAAQKTLELAQAYCHYDRLLFEEGVLDFASLHFLTLKLFEQHPSVLRYYQERFKTILVDEFQDTNTAQNRLVELLASGHQNIMVVGDDDQSIYKWRGASLANILEFESKFPTCKKVVLTENYRSNQPILDMSHAVIQHNNPHRLEVREGLDKKLQSVCEVTATQPEVVHFDHYLAEVQFVVEEIVRRVDQGALYCDFAVLVRASAHALPFLEELQRRGLPTYFSGAQGLFQREEIKDLMALLRLLMNPHDDIALFRLLSMEVFGIESEHLLRLVSQAKQTSTPLLEIARKGMTQPDLFSHVGVGTGLGSFLELFAALQDLCKTHAASHVLGHFLKKSHTLSRLGQTDSPENTNKLQNIAAFSQLIRAFEDLHPTAYGVVSVLDYLTARHDVGDRSAPIEESLETDTVKVLTVHAAKGLEFDTVFVVNLVQHRFPSINRHDAFDIPEVLFSQMLDDDDPHLSEERRLFYVACTRAKSHLYLTYSERYSGPKRWKPSCFIQEALDSGVTESVEGATRLSPDFLPVIATDAPEEKPLVFGYERSHRSLRLSFSKINTFETCPLKYKFQYVYQLPSPPSHPTSFGLSVHNALNAFYQRLLAGEKPSKELLYELYEEYWVPLGYDSAAHQRVRKAKGRALLDTFYETNSSPWMHPKYLEKPFTLKLENGLTISGRIDRIDPLPDGTFEVIDYKTGSMKPETALDQDLQLSIYALACRDIFHLNVSQLSLYYLEGNQKISTQRSPEQLKTTLLDLETVAQTIQSSRFDATPSAHVCGYCDYRLICDRAAV